MTKLAIVDLDMNIADNTARMNRAALARHSKMLEFDLPVTQANEKEGTAVYWQTAFMPELVSLDRLIPGIMDALATLGFSGYLTILLTSRPEHMREATVKWLFEQGFPAELLCSVPSALIMKPSAFQYTKTTVWKAGMVQTLAALYGASEVIIVDDEEANLEAMLTGDMYNGYKSLEEAVQALTEGK